jgi:hypothetical protein
MPGSTQFFLAVDGQQKGPYDMSSLGSQVAAGVLTRETLVWTEGMAEWKSAGEVPELAPLFGFTPPPIPAA